MLLHPVADSFAFDPRKLIMGPFIKCPKCHRNDFGILTVGPHSFERRCRDCWHNARYYLPDVKKTIIYLDQFAVTNLMLVRTKSPRRPDSFYFTLYEKLMRLSMLQAIVCPYSNAHRDESVVYPDHKALRNGYEMFAHSVYFESFEIIRHCQIIDRVSKAIHDDSPCSVGRKDVLAGDNPDVWIHRIRVSVDMVSPTGFVEKLHEWRGKSHAGLIDVFTNTWKKQPERTWEHWRDSEAQSCGPQLMRLFLEYAKKWDDITHGRREVEGLDDMAPAPVVLLCNGIMARFRNAGHSVKNSMKLTAGFFHSKAMTLLPYVQISCSLYASLAKKAFSQVKPPTQGFFSDVDVMSCLLPYCDAMFMDRECAAYWKEIQTSPSRRLPYETRVFSLAAKKEFLDYLDELERAVPEVQRRYALEVYGPKNMSGA